MIYEFLRGHVHHRYEVRAEGLWYSSGLTEVQVRWPEIAHLAPAKGEYFFLILKKGRSKLAIWLDAAQMEPFLKEFLTAWRRADRDGANKAMFDYSSSNKSAGWLWITVSFIFPGMLALLLLLDGLKTLQCNPLLDQGKSVPAKVAKVTKDRRGNTVWKLEFTTETGLLITGKRTAFFSDEKGNPKGPVSVVYSPENTGCWDLNMASEGTAAVNHNQRNFYLWFELYFGGFFAILFALGTVLGILKLKARRPFKDSIGKFLATSL